MTSRREFVGLSALGLAASSTWSQIGQSVEVQQDKRAPSPPAQGPVVISTWKHGVAANAAAWEILSAGGRALDAVERGVRVSEADGDVTSVGLGGLPDRTGRVSLDACVMDERGECGAVAFLEHIKHPVSVARLVMEKTPHVMLVGEGALEFALAQGFSKENLLTPQSEEAWRTWRAQQEGGTARDIPATSENHDTIGMVAIDAAGNLSGACTTSGTAWKMRGRVGDSPIIGAGLYVDNAVGGACATGVGEAVIRVCGSFLVIEQMRLGKSPQEACRAAIERITQKTRSWREIQVGLIALSKDGQIGAYSIAKGFEYAVYDPRNGNRLLTAESLLELRHGT